MPETGPLSQHCLGEKAQSWFGFGQTGYIVFLVKHSIYVDTKLSKFRFIDVALEAGAAPFWN